MEGQTDVAMMSAMLRDAQNERDRLRANLRTQQERGDLLLAQRNEARAKVAKVEALADEWAEHGEDSDYWRVFGPQVLSVPFAVSALRAVLAEAAPALPTSQTTEGGCSDAPAEQRAEGGV